MSGFKSSVGPFGGSCGFAWDDKRHGGIKTIKIVTGLNDEIVSMSVEYDDNGKSTWTHHGAAIGLRPYVFSLDYPKEYLISVKIYYQAFLCLNKITGITFITNRKEFGTASKCFLSSMGVEISFPSVHAKIVGFHGKSCVAHLVALGAHLEDLSPPAISPKPITPTPQPVTKPPTPTPQPVTKPPTPTPQPVTKPPTPTPQPTMVESIGPFGGGSGKVWDDGVNDGIKKITIGLGEDEIGIGYLAAQYVKANYSVFSELHGRTQYGNPIEIKLDSPNEYLVKITGYYDTLTGFSTPLVQALTFVTNKGTYGPYGSETGTYFSIGKANAHIVGLFGRAGIYVDAIGAHLRPTKI